MVRAAWIFAVVPSSVAAQEISLLSSKIKHFDSDGQTETLGFD